MFVNVCQEVWVIQHDISYIVVHHIHQQYNDRMTDISQPEPNAECRESALKAS